MIAGSMGSKDGGGGWAGGKGCVGRMSTRARERASGEVALYVAEALTSMAATWLSTGLLFVTAKILGWGTQANLTLAAGQGVVYMVGSLASSRASGWRGRKPLLISLYLMMALMTLGMAMVAESGAALVAMLMVWTLMSSANWPALAGMLCHGGSAEEVSRRVGRYNLVWAATGAVAIAGVAGVMAVWPLGVFYISTVLHLLSAGLVWWSGDEPGGADAHLNVPAELVAKRGLAKRLSRMALPASYTVIFSLTPILASLPAVQAMPGGWQSVAVSVWLVSRVVTFWVMGWTRFWHTRPGVLMGAVVVMALSFGVAAGSGLLPVPVGSQLAALIGAQLVLGVAMGVIYSGSLYFGMVLSHNGDGEGGSTEQGGYHEAMIGAGTILGPAAGVVAILSGTGPAVGVGLVVVVCVGLCGAAAMRKSVGANAASVR